jgi:hypothetical protein
MSERNSHQSFGSSPRDHLPPHVDDQLAAYTGGECSEFERVAIERHLDACALCRAALDETRRIRALLASLSAQGTPISVADSVLARLTAPMEDLPDQSSRDGTSVMEVMEDSSQSTDCPVSPAEAVPLSVVRLEPRQRRGSPPSVWRQRVGAQERDLTRMERHQSAGASTRERPADRGRLRSFAPVAVAVALIALSVGAFGMLSHRTTIGPGGQAHGTGTASAQGVQADLPANSTLDGVSMDSPVDGWAVGTVYNAPNGMGGSKNALLVHYDGHRWITSPDSANFARGNLISVSMVSADDGWAVGSQEDASHIPVAGLLLHYTGGHWRKVDIANTGFMGGGKVQMMSASEGWLYAPVGGKGSAGRETLIIYYHNGSWRLFSTLPGRALVSMLSVHDGWAVNQMTNAILRYQNGAWSQVATAPGQPLVMAMVSPTEGWIAGSVVNGQNLFAMRYDGSSWSQMTLPAARSSEVDQIAVAGPGDIWIFGRIDTSTNATTVAWRFNASHWTRVGLNFQAFPTGASMASPTSGWVTGNAGNSAALLRYDRGAWDGVYYGK